MIPAGSELKLCCVNCEEAIDEIGQRTWVLRHESVPTVRGLSQPRAGDRVYEFQRVRRRGHDVFTAGAELALVVIPRSWSPATVAVPLVHCGSLPVDKPQR